MKASKATDDAEMQLKLGLKAFMKAVPEIIGRDLRRKRFGSVREALEEARFLQWVQEYEVLKEQIQGCIFFPHLEKISPPLFLT